MLELIDNDERLEVEADEIAKFTIITDGMFEGDRLGITLDREQCGQLVEFLVDWLAEGEEGLH